jgi:hypothetical protein
MIDLWRRSYRRQPKSITLDIGDCRRNSRTATLSRCVP